MWVFFWETLFGVRSGAPRLCLREEAKEEDPESGLGNLLEVIRLGVPMVELDG